LKSLCKRFCKVSLRNMGGFSRVWWVLGTLVSAAVGI